MDIEPVRLLITNFGTRGDFEPFLALAEELAAHLSSEDSESLARSLRHLELAELLLVKIEFAHGHEAPQAQQALLTSQVAAIIGLLFILVIFVTMVYGPIAAMLVELFPTRIRYTSMSLPYHIGNGWFGGMLPLLATAIVAAKGNIYAGLWYPIIVSVMTVVIGALFVREPKHVRIRDETF